jgi:hypothetical protein
MVFCFSNWTQATKDEENAEGLTEGEWGLLEFVRKCCENVEFPVLLIIRQTAVSA